MQYIIFCPCLILDVKTGWGREVIGGVEVVEGGRAIF
jgi:hypothetical protein